jgi:DNA-binding response OmpR family regulator
MMSAHPDARELCMEAGADDFIPKPFDIKSMYSKIDRFIK